MMKSIAVFCKLTLAVAYLTPDLQTHCMRHQAPTFPAMIQVLHAYYNLCIHAALMAVIACP